MKKKDQRSDIHPAAQHAFDSLQSLGINVRLAERGRAEEEFTFKRGRGQGFLGN